MKKRRKRIDYGKWGYIFILPFFLIFFIFSFIPLVDTIRYSFFEYYRSGMTEIGPNFVGLKNYASLLNSDMLKYAANTMIMLLPCYLPTGLLMQDLKFVDANSSKLSFTCQT